MKKYDVIIIGAGASGLLCAIECAKRGRRTAVLDLGAKSGRKVRIAGGGRCNFTNLELNASHYISGNTHFVKSALARFTPYDILGLLAENGLGYEEKAEGQLFCEQGGAAVAGVLERLVGEAGATLHMQTEVQDARQEGDGFVVETDKGAFGCASLVVATGGRSWPGVGATGTGYELATRFGLKVVPPQPALAPLVIPKWEHSDISGVALTARVSCKAASFTDGILFTHKGLSGPAILQISSYWKKGEALHLDLLPGQDMEALLDAARVESGKVQLKNFMAGHLPSRLAESLFPRDGKRTLAELDRKTMQSAAGRVHGWTVTPSRTEGWDKAEVTAGGVDTQALSSKTMEAKNVPGLYFIGEVQDVTGWLGGYNLQWAWSSGYAAGQYA